MDNNFEAAFDKFLETSVYDSAEEILFQILRGAFTAGWNASKADSKESSNT